MPWFGTIVRQRAFHCGSRDQFGGIKMLEPAARYSRVRILVAVVAALSFSLSVFALTPPIVAKATWPPGSCTSDEDGKKVVTADGKIWECKFVEGQGYVWVHIATIILNAVANNLIVSAELGYTGGY